LELSLLILLLADNDYIFQDEAKPVQDHNNNLYILN